MSDLDQILSRLGAVPMPDELAGIDSAVFAGLARNRRESVAASRMTSLAASLALVLGVAGGAFSASARAAAAPLSPFAADAALAPSTLLAVHP